MSTSKTVAPTMEFPGITEVKSCTNLFKLISLNKTVSNELRDLCQHKKCGSGFSELLSTHCQKLCALQLEKIQSNSTDLIVLLQIHSRADLMSVGTAKRGNIRHSGVKTFLSSHMLPLSFLYHLDQSADTCFCTCSFSKKDRDCG